MWHRLLVIIVLLSCFSLSANAQEKGLSSESIDALINALNDANPKIRLQIIRELGQEKNHAEKIIPVLITLLQKDPKDYIRYNAALELGHLQSPSAVPALIEAIKSREPFAKAGALSGVGDIGFEASSALPVLLETLKEPDAYMKTKAISSIAQIKSDIRFKSNKYGELVPSDDDMDIVVDALFSAFDDPDDDVRYSVVNAFGFISQRAPKGITLLIKALEDDNKSVREQAAQSLGNYLEVATPAVPALIRSLQDVDASVRQISAQSLRNIGTAAKEAIPLLTKLANSDPDNNVRTTAKQTLDFINR